MSYLNSITIVGFVGADRSSVKRETTVRNSPFFLSPRNAPGKTQKTNGSRKSSGIALRSGHFWQSVSLRLSRRALTFSSKAVSSARLTSSPTARARKPRPPRSRRGRFAPTLCENWTAANRNWKRRHPAWMLRDNRPNHPARFTTSGYGESGLPRRSGGPFFLRVRPPLHQGDHVLVRGHLVGSKCQHEHGKAEMAKAANALSSSAYVPTPVGGRPRGSLNPCRYSGSRSHFARSFVLAWPSQRPSDIRRRFFSLS
jgi:hypothetical protein